MRVVFIADYFSNEIVGGGELNNRYLCDMLVERGYEVEEVKSVNVTLDFLKKNKEKCFIVANFVELSPASLEYLTKCRYIIYEHDHKYLRNRNPATFPNYTAPSSQIVNREFYRNALGVFCQSKFHSEILFKNLHIDNIKNLSGNIWSDEVLDFIEGLSVVEKDDSFSIVRSDIGHKNTFGAVKYCEGNNYDYVLISDRDYFSFLKKMSRQGKFVFIPQTPETLSRVVVEARMMGIEVHTGSNVGASSEDWFHLSGKELIDEMRKRKEDIVDAIEETFRENKCSYFVTKEKRPKISIVTSLYNGDQYIEDFLNNITSQTIFDQCELIIIDANSPGNEKAVIDGYIEKYPNIIYERLESDPGIYGCWNRGIEISTGEYITNANLDDRRSRQQLEIFSDVLENNPDVDLVYSECFVTNSPNESYDLNSSGNNVYPIKDFSKENMIKCLPGCMPLWRKSMHSKSGNFMADYKSAGDWEMWLRAVRGGSLFKRVDGVHGLYYNNPKGLSTDRDKEREKLLEEKKVFFEYTDIFGEEVSKQYEGYFGRI